MPEEKGPRQIRLFIAVVLCVFAILVARLGYLQVAQGDSLAARSDQNRLRLVRINAPRGVIYDRNRVQLAASRLAFSLVVVPEALTNAEAELARLAEILGVPAADLAKKISRSNHRAYEGVVVAGNLDQTAILQLAEAEGQLPGVMLQQMPVRNYPRGEFASHLLGYVGEINAAQLAEKKEQGYRLGEIVGQDGLEKVYDQVLQGTDGGRLLEVDHLDRPSKTAGYVDPVPGKGLVLTIDAKLQEAAEKALAEQLVNLRAKRLAPQADAGAVIALDPRTGEVLALASQPGFDPNLFVGGIKPDDYNRLASDPRLPFTNRVVAGAFPAGSTFKVVTGLAALSEGLVNLADRFFCNGYDPVYAKKKCWNVGNEKIHGVQDLITGFKNSCNIVFYELGRRLGPDKLAKYARLLGLGELTGINLPGERKGLVPDTAWKKAVYKERWYFPESMDFAIGQGFLNMTPVQLAQVYMALANGGTIYRPNLVRAILDQKGRVVEEISPAVTHRLSLDQEALAIVRRGMEAVTAQGGTAYGSFRDMPIKVAGKTGTAQNSQGPSHGWFAGIAPAADPRLVVVVLVEHGTSGSLAAAPVARKIFDAYFGLKTTVAAAASAPAETAGVELGD